MENSDILIKIKVRKDRSLILEDLIFSASAPQYIELFPAADGYNIEYIWPNGNSFVYSSPMLLE